MEIKFNGIDSLNKTAVFFVSKDNKFTSELERLDGKANGIIAKALEEADFDGKAKKFVTITYPGDELARIIIVGTGDTM